MEATIDVVADEFAETTATPEGPIELTGSAGITRDPDENDEVVLETEDGRRSLGVRDVTVSQGREGKPAIEVETASTHVRVVNNWIPTGIRIQRSTGEEVELEAGETATLVSDATLELGYATTIDLSVDFR
ncbi:hypothetical protein BRD00_10880 [Halobacteriales archaeon QS_8_69_26]|nr:MAG: hypothetical protein BRD00_10880 [Halobacteriales archaeon QS_8_69_26]